MEGFVLFSYYLGTFFTVVEVAVWRWLCEVIRWCGCNTLLCQCYIQWCKNSCSCRSGFVFFYYYYYLGTLFATIEVVVWGWLWKAICSEVSCRKFQMSMNNKRELLGVKFVVRMKLWRGGCACVDVIINFRAKFARIINIQINFLIVI